MVSDLHSYLLEENTEEKKIEQQNSQKKSQDEKKKRTHERWMILVLKKHAIWHELDDDNGPKNEKIRGSISPFF